MSLISLSRATELVPNFPSADNDIMQDCVDAASEVVCRYCNRDFVLTTYDELYDGTGAYNLLLNQYPVSQVLRVSFNPINMIQIRMTDQEVSRASFRMDGDSSSPPKPNQLYLVSLKDGIETDININLQTGATTVNGIAGTTYAMLTTSDLAAAINGAGGSYGWQSQGLGIYTTWPVADLRPPQGGFEARWFGVSYLKLHSWNLSDFEQNPDIGEVYSPMGFDFGYRNYRVVYQAGYQSVPEQIQQATAALAVSVYLSRGQNANVASESLGGYSYSNVAEKSFHQLDIVTRYGLALFKNHRVAKFKVAC